MLKTILQATIVLSSVVLLAGCLENVDGYYSSNGSNGSSSGYYSSQTSNEGYAANTGYTSSQSMGSGRRMYSANNHVGNAYPSNPNGGYSSSSRR